VPENSNKAFEYYDRAAEFDPYALLKLGQFMEQGKYEEGYKGVKNLQYAYGFYYRSTQFQDGCREALFKLGEYHHYGRTGDKNLGQAIRKYQESAAEGHAEAMNALGSLFYNEMRDYKQAAEWFKKAADRGFSRALNNLGTCYEFGQGVDRDRDAAFQLYKESAEKGNVDAMLNLAQMYFTNATRTHNMEQFREAQVWFRTIMLKDPEMWQPYYYLG